jgi:hypothetical protein
MVEQLFQYGGAVALAAIVVEKSFQVVRYRMNGNGSANPTGSECFGGKTIYRDHEKRLSQVEAITNENKELLHRVDKKMDEMILCVAKLVANTKQRKEDSSSDAIK